MIRLVLCFLVCILIVSGCGFKDIDKRFFVLAIGVDATDHEQTPYRVSLKLGIPQSKIEPGKTDKYQIVSQEAESITEAVRLLKSNVDKEFDFGHAKVFIFGKKLASGNMKEVIDWFVRRRDIQGVGFTAIGDPAAIDVLKVNPVSERLPANALFLSFDHEGTESAYIITETLSDFYRRMTEKGKDPYLPVIHVTDHNFEINRVALLDKHKVKITLNPNETRVLNELMREFNKIDIRTKEADKKLYFNINQFKRKITFVDPQNLESTIVRLNVSITGIVEESTQPIFDEDWRKIEQSAEKELETRFTRVLNTMQKNRVDPIGFGLRYRSLGFVSEEDWTRWMDWYPKLQFEIYVKLKLVGSGVIK